MTEHQDSATQEQEYTLLGREDIVNIKDDTTYEIVPTPEWRPGSAVRVKSLSSEERDDFEESFIKRGKKSKETEVSYANMRAKLAVRAIVDNDGKRVFGDHEAAALGKRNGAVLDRIFNVVTSISGMSDQDVQELLGNSKNGRSGGS